MAVADVTQTTAASQPLLLDWSGVNYWWGSGVSGNYCIAAKTTAMNFLGDFDIKMDIKIESTSGNRSIISRRNTNGYSWQCYMGTTGLINFNDASLTVNATSTVAYPYNTTNTRSWLRITRNSTSGEINFYTSTDAISWTSIGTTVTSGTGNMTSSNADLEILSNLNGTNSMPIGKIYRATISNSIGGTPVVDFNPASYNAATSQTAWTSATGEVWTINTGTATTGYKGVLVNRTVMQSDGVDDNIVASYSTSGYKSIYAGKLKYTNSAGSAYATLALSGNATWLCALFSGDSYYQNGSNAGAFATAVNNKIESIGTTMNTSDVTPTWQAVKNGALINMATISPKDVGTTTSGWNALYLFSRGNNTQYANLIVNTVILTGQLDTNTQLVTTSNLIKTMNSL